MLKHECLLATLGVDTTENRTDLPKFLFTYNPDPLTPDPRRPPPRRVKQRTKFTGFCGVFFNLAEAKRELGLDHVEAAAFTTH